MAWGCGLQEVAARSATWQMWSLAWANDRTKAGEQTHDGSHSWSLSTLGQVQNTLRSGVLSATHG